MERFYSFTLIAIFVAVILAVFYLRSETEPNSASTTKSQIPAVLSPTPSLAPIPDSYRMEGGVYAGQTFNNCGPASLSMALSQNGINISQAELASKLRPFNNPLGGVDDKAVLGYELVAEAKNQGLEAVDRPNGTPETIRRLLAHDVSVILRTWLNPNEDIGHYRVLTGYDKNLGVFYANDSYHGPNIVLDEGGLLDMWQPFNYGYIAIYPKEKEKVVQEIVGDDLQEETAWENALDRANTEVSENPNDAYALFNKSVALFYLGRYDEAVSEYERSAPGLPPRMLWYQLEPIYSYQKTGQFDKAIPLIDRILFNGNLAYSELYQVKGEIYLTQGDRDRARGEFEKAVQYNKNFLPAREALSKLDSS